MTKLLLHVCCAPCLSGCIEPLLGKSDRSRVILSPEFHQTDFDLTFFYYNPNISPQSEHDFRFDELSRFCETMNLPEPIFGEYEDEIWMKEAILLKDEPERGKRCHYCYEMRLRKSFETAKELGMEIVATTLTLSPHKLSAKMNEIGERLSREFGIKYLSTDFKKSGGMKRSIELSEQMNLYRQDYCGCVFSRKQNFD